MLCGLHVRIILVFDAVFDGIVVADAGWKVLRTTFDQLAMELMRDLPPPAQAKESGAPPDGSEPLERVWLSSWTLSCANSHP